MQHAINWFEIPAKDFKRATAFYQTVLGATRNLDHSATLLSLAERSYEAAQRRYRMGAGSVLELLNAQTSLATGKRQRIRALTDWRSARLQLAAKLGDIGDNP